MAKERAKLDLLVWDEDKAERWQLSSGPWIMVGAAKDAGDIPQVSQCRAPELFGFVEMSTILKWFGREDKDKEEKEEDKEVEKGEEEKTEGEKEKDKKEEAKPLQGDGGEDRSSSSSSDGNLEEARGSNKDDEKEDKD